ncbi:ABC transporter ATP-binding protein [Corynebacterium appendicis]|uniref:ABC transporter ATP-binding protein n=1 Tax=Corynebacterium appendicis TaxID=163202 RepID=UPI00223B7102|nr:ABC transporter ATP-binding protein [Corynebacterium appendicis]MCT1684821.1 ABC transporter ATP-binding protein [Corynebacterium appendicis]
MAKNKSPDSAVTMSGASARIVDNATFSVPRGTMAALVGPSGSGKTTLMRMIVGTQAKVTGDVQVLGLPAGHPDLRRRVTYATQAASIFEDLTVKENLDYIRRIYGLSPQEQDSIVEKLELQKYTDRVCGQLSGGQRSRVSLAVALLPHPELMILDEPTVGLDPLLRQQLWGLFHELAEAGTTLLISSHMLGEADHCERILFVRDGRVMQTTHDEILAQTGSNSMDEAFLAVMNQ